MQRATLTDLFDRNHAHVEQLAEDPFAEVQDAQAPAIVSMCCSDSRVSQEGMFDATDPGWLFSPSTIGNQVVDLVDGERVVDGSLLYPIHHAGTRTVAVVGHTGCGAITAAYEATQGQASELAPGIAKRVALLGPVVADAVREDHVDRTAPRERVIDQLVEINVHEQIGFLVESPEIPDDADLYGFVYDLHGAYGGPRGRAWLVNADGVQDLEALRERVPHGYEDRVASLLR